MALKCITESWRGTALALATVALLGGAPARGHDVRRSGPREIVWLQGRRAAPGKEVSSARPLVVRALGEDSRFLVAEFRTFGAGETAPGPAAPGSERFDLQGRRDLLRRFAGARPDQRVTLLAERRPGGADLFVLAIDLCPPK